ncbi:MAG: hypothetical protein AB1861_19070 [Cyanobacteriota bacterium]
MSLAELVIALGLSSLLMVLVVSGALFVRRYIADWSNRDKVTEELAFLKDELALKLESAVRVQIFKDSLAINLTDRNVIRYWVSNGTIFKDGRQISRVGFSVHLCPLPTILLLQDSTTDSLSAENTIGVYNLAVAVSDSHGNADTLRLYGRNIYESLKYRQD